MRTTVDIDPDLAARLRAITHERDISLKEAINEALRAGLTPSAGAARRYKVRARPMRLRRGIDLDKALSIASAAEDEEIVRKLELRK